MRSSAIFNTLAVFSAASAVGATENEKTLPCPSNICFSSFYSDSMGSFWVKEFTDPSLVYMWNSPLLFDWVTRDKSSSSNFTLEWLMQDIPGGPDNNSSKVVWSQNITSSMSFNLQPTDNSSFWPTTAAPNMTHFQAIGYGSGLNQFRISKAGALNASDPTTYDLSRPFTLRQYWHDRHAQYRAKEIDDVLEDAKKVKMYLAVGIVLSGIVAGLAGCLLGWWSARRNLKRTGGFAAQDKAGAFESMR